MTIIDKRKSGKNKSVENRQRFVKRYKNHIKKSIHEQDGSVTDGPSNRRVKISKKDLHEPDFNLDPSTGRGQRVLPGNKDFGVGDRIRKPESGQGRGTSGGNGGGGEDDFSFVLTKDEFIDIYFSEMELPNFIKKSLKDNSKTKLVRAGYTKEGIPPRLDILKTVKQSIARRVATGSERFLDEIDLRYKLFVQKPFPIKSAHVFFLMDVSGSMGEYEKMLAKKFFMLLHLFLTTQYEKISVTFVRHTESASEVTENEFFYSRESGGTIVSVGLAKVNEIIDTKVNLNETNVYVAQASDGDNWFSDQIQCVDQLETLLDKVQYMAYIQTETDAVSAWRGGEDSLIDTYMRVSNKKLNCRRVANPQDVYPVLKDLFKKE